ncbi:DUF6371 domain-containing protein [Prosthecochloris vibrioformis]|uniref:DUF6371 domain-containing protein n=1 Tax=Prosthecochloris vibrioformis TaxID=1098 RepID=A0A5C4S2P7_PROVB|nr:DUF6371 domain-containing protein [Prosthecochloris vibrioformis]TNJ37407.1 hypothetical protein FGF68_04140 [Prosthecochloris vibrioformis]
MTEQALQIVRERLPDYVAAVTTKSKGGFWVCPLCGSGTGKNKSGAFKVQDEKWRCFACGRGGDVLDLLGEIEGLQGFRDQVRRAEELFRIDGSMTAGAAPVRSESKPEPVFISPETMQASFNHYDQNNFALWLVKVFGEEKALELAFAYGLGTAKHWPGACVFWQIDEAWRVRRGKVMLYNSETGGRVKEPGNMVAGVHWLLGMRERNPEPCLFGLHLAAADWSKPVAVVESEKSAIIGAGFVPEFIWTATGGSGSLNRSILEPLQGRRIVLFPDLGAFDKWSEKSAKWPGVEVSPMLERRASAEDRAAGLDVADYLLREHFSTAN